MDFDSVDYSNAQIDNTVVVDKLLFNEKNGTLKITFQMTGNTLKINKVEEL